MRIAKIHVTESRSPIWGRQKKADEISEGSSTKEVSILKVD